MIDDVLAQRLITAARKGREWAVRRDQLIVEAVESGATQKEVAKLVGLTQPAISMIVSRQSTGTSRR